MNVIRPGDYEFFPSVRKCCVDECSEDTHETMTVVWGSKTLELPVCAAHMAEAKLPNRPVSMTFVVMK